MELDELKERWAEHDRKLDESIRLNRRLLRDMYTRRARFALWRLAAMLAAGALFMLAIIVSLGRFIAQNWSMPRIVWPAIVLDVLAIATLAALNAQIGLALNINYNQPIAVIQKRLETLRKFRIRYIQAIFLMATLTWVPIFIVLTRLFDTAWVVANVVFGLLVLAIGVWVARRYGDRMSNSAFGRRFLRELAGYNLNAASDFMATLAEFEKD
jgi:cellulose synthase/poly-beta-1,6-N-acetylglucosamine synthase-like glycosyltransferase